MDTDDPFQPGDINSSDGPGDSNNREQRGGYSP